MYYAVKQTTSAGYAVPVYQTCCSMDAQRKRDAFARQYPQCEHEVEKVYGENHHCEYKQCPVHGRYAG